MYTQAYTRSVAVLITIHHHRVGRSANNNNSYAEISINVNEIASVCPCCDGIVLAMWITGIDFGAGCCAGYARHPCLSLSMSEHRNDEHLQIIINPYKLTTDRHTAQPPRIIGRVNVDNIIS